MHSRCRSREDGEFDFYIEAQDSFGAYSLPLWESNTITNITDSSPLLPHNHHSTNLSSPASARRALISESRRQLMEMIHDMPESCYELSLKDIVDQQQEDIAAEGSVVKDIDPSLRFDTKAQIRKRKKKKKSFKTGQLSRIKSMENETFLIKMYIFPITFPSSNKNGKSASRSDQRHKNKDGWLMRLVIAGFDKITFRRKTSRSNSGSDNSTTRYMIFSSVFIIGK